MMKKALMNAPASRRCPAKYAHAYSFPPPRRRRQMVFLADPSGDSTRLSKYASVHSGSPSLLGGALWPERRVWGTSEVRFSHQGRRFLMNPEVIVPFMEHQVTC